MTTEKKRRKPQARTAVTRANILEATADLARGAALEDLTAEAIAKQAGVAKGTVFAHFGDMDGLLSHILLDQIRSLATAAQGDISPADDDQSNPVDALLSRMMQFIEVITSSQTMLRVFMENIGVTKGHCAPDFIEQLDILDAHLICFLKHWQSSEEMYPALRQDRTPEEMHDGLVAFILHGAILYRSHQVEDLQVIRDRLYRHVEAFLIRSP